MNDDNLEEEITRDQKPTKGDYLDDLSLAKSFSSITNTYYDIENSDLPTNSQRLQELVRKAIDTCEKSVHSINQMSLFSKNESVTEIPTENLRYLLLPAFLGYFTLKLVDGDRLQDILKAKVELQSDDDDGSEESKEKRKPQNTDAFTRKEEKVRRYKEKKSLDEKLKALNINGDNIDEDTQREYYCTLLKQWVLNSVEEMDLVEQEIPILEHMAKMRVSGKPPDVSRPKEKPKPLRPFILTKTDLQKQVFGAGYPSVPTYTVEEFYDAQLSSGAIPAPGGGGPSAAATDAEREEQEAIVKEYKLEKDDSDELKKAREWDDWKDDHRRGWGNRKNMG